MRTQSPALAAALAAVAVACLWQEASAFVPPAVTPLRASARLPSPLLAPSAATTPAARGTHATRLAFWKGLGGGNEAETQPAVVEEEDDGLDEDEREARRLRAILDKRLVLAGQAMIEDWPVYLFLVGVQALPVMLGGAVGANFLFFWLTAVTCVYLGGKRCAAVAKAGEVFQSVNTRNAVFAPIAASVSLFGTYYLLKNQFDIATVYQLMTTAFGWYCLRDVLVSALLALALAFNKEGAPTIAEPSSSSFFPFPSIASFVTEDASGQDILRAPVRSPEEGELNGVKVAASLLAAAVCATYLWGPAAAVAAASSTAAGGQSVAWLGAIGALLAANCITSGIALQAQASIPIKSLKPAIIFLTGLFLYDIYFVFLSPGGVMESVATSLEGPVKLLSPRAASATAPGQYPFSILGLGDIVVPGLFVGLLKRIDDALAAERGEENSRNTFFKSGLAGYSLGLLLTFSANLIYKTGQPALLYIVPSLIAASLATGAATGQWEELWGFNAGDGEDEEGQGASRA